MATNYLPNLGSLISTSDIPEELGIIKEVLEPMFQHLFYQNFVHSTSASGDNTAVAMELVANTRVAWEVEGTDGLAFVLNPDYVSNTASILPLKVEVAWKLLQHVRDIFQLSESDFSFESLLSIMQSIAQISDGDLLKAALDEENDGLDKLEWFVSDFNSEFNPTPTLVVGSFQTSQEAFEDVGSQITSLHLAGQISVPFSGYLLYKYILVSIAEGDNVWESFCAFFSRWLGNFSHFDLKALLKPSIKLTILGVHVAVEFPRTVLKPVLPSGEVEPNPAIKASLVFSSGNFFFSTEEGIGFDKSISASFPPAYPSAQIGNTGIKLSLTEAKLDLSRVTNLAEADADGRPSDFMGVYIDQATIAFPKFWQQDPNGPPSTAQIVGRKLLIGTGGFSGRIALEGSNQGDLFHTRLNNPNGFAIGLHAFEVKFHQNAIVGSTIRGWLTIPGLEDKNNPGQPAKSSASDRLWPATAI